MKRLGSVAVLFLVLVLGWAAPAAAAVYEVRPGDSLYLIAKRFGSTVDSLRVWNDYWDYYVYPGQKLLVPDRYAYVVRSGDSLYKIGLRYGVDPWQLAAWNNLSGTDIYPGQVLAVPPPGSQPSPSRGVSDADLNLLARLITAEADGEPYVAKVAVAAVVLNRVRSAVFPNTIAGVIYDYRDGAFQFTPVMNGWINVAPSPEAYRAAHDALSGWDPTNGALYYFSWWVDNPWLWSLPTAAVYGNLVFKYGYTA